MEDKSKSYRIEYEIPPLRAIYFTHFTADNTQSIEAVVNIFMSIVPEAHIRNIKEEFEEVKI